MTKTEAQIQLDIISTEQAELERQFRQAQNALAVVALTATEPEEMKQVADGAMQAYEALTRIKQNRALLEEKSAQVEAMQ